MPPGGSSDRPSSGRKSDYDLSLCVSLLAMLDFRGDKQVYREDWQRGTRAMNLIAMGEDDGLWSKLLDKFGAGDGVAIDLRKVEDLVPIDPRVGLLLKVCVASASTCMRFAAFS